MMKANSFAGLMVAAALVLLAHAAGAQELDTVTVVAGDTSYLLDTEQAATEYPPVIYNANSKYEPLPAAADTAPNVYRAVPQSAVSALQKDKQFAYANDPAYWKKEKPKPRQLSWVDWLITRKWLQYFLVGLVIAAVLFALIRILISNKILLFRRSRSRSWQGEDMTEEQADLPALIADAEQEGKFRQAVRLRYVKALHDMNAQGLISLSAQRTNWDYVNQFSSHPLKKTFLLLTRAYEYVWYGEFELNAAQYGLLKAEFIQFENSLRA